MTWSDNWTANDECYQLYKNQDGVVGFVFEIINTEIFHDIAATHSPTFRSAGQIEVIFMLYIHPVYKNKIAFSTKMSEYSIILWLLNASVIY